MREVNPVVAGGVIPTSVHIDKSSVPTRERQVAVCLIDQTTGPLPLEVEEYV
jgi:hypothetical protein